MKSILKQALTTDYSSPVLSYSFSYFIYIND
jgi:hypothetical protein